MEAQRDRIETRYNAICREISDLTCQIHKTVEERTARLDSAARALNTKLRDQENKLVEQLWVESLDADLRGLVDQVPTAQELLSNGLGHEIARLTGGNGRA